MHPEQREIEQAAALHAGYYKQLVFVHNIHPDNATSLTQTFMELALADKDEEF